MIQKKLTVTNLDEFKEIFPDFKKEIEGITFSQVAVEILFANTSEGDITELQSLLMDDFDNIHIVGTSTGGLLGLYEVPSIIILNFNFLTEAVAKSFYWEFDRESDSLLDDVIEYARRLRENILQIKDAKCVEVFFTWIKASASAFVDELSKGLDDIPIYGAIANANFTTNMDGLIASGTSDAVVVGDGKVGPGISAMVYSGPDLYVYCDYLLGWEPVGRAMEARTYDDINEGFTTITELDGIRPVDIYDKYLGVKADKRFVYNICEFPLVIERNGILIGRTPSRYGDEGELFLEGDILKGEKVRFSYGEYEDILNGTRNAAMRMSAFEPETLSLVICGNRIIFLQNDSHLEIDYYSEGREVEALPILGMGEIYKYNGKGGVLNSALVAVGMREGLGGQLMGNILKKHSIHYHDGAIPLSERLSHFIKAITGELIDAVKEAEAANKAKGAFLSNMSHEIRTPINAILGMNEMILRESSEANILEYADNIRSAGNSLLGIVNDILDFSKIEAGKMEIVPVEYDMASVLNDLVNMIKKRADDKGLRLVVEVDPKTPHLLFGDEIRIKQILTNILTNAVKYTEKGNIILSVKVNKLDKDEVIIHYSVKDTGIGIKEKDISKLFSAFERIEEKRNRTVEGTGLGMSITQNLLNLMGSKLNVSSVYGEGSEFSFDISQSVIDDKPIGDYEEALKRSISARKEYRESFIAPDAWVLVVDDTPMNLTVISNLLKKTKVNIDTASSGDECISMMQKKKYDMVFLDHRMPGKDGIETLNCIRDDDKINQDIPIIALTANAISGSRDLYMNAGFNDYLSKPIDPDTLEGIMAKLLPEEKVQIIEDKDSTGSDDVGVIPESIEKSNFFDIKKGIKNCGSKRAYLDALKSYLESAEDNIKRVKEFYEKKDISNYTIKVHALKSSSRIVGLEGLGKLSEEMEEAGNRGDLELIETKTHGLLETYRKIVDVLGNSFSPPKEEASKEFIDPSKLREAYDAMREIAQLYDYDNLLMVFESLSAYEIPDEEKDKMMKLKTAIRDTDWETIMKLL